MAPIIGTLFFSVYFFFRFLFLFIIFYILYRRWCSVDAVCVYYKYSAWNISTGLTLHTVCYLDPFDSHIAIRQPQRFVCAIDFDSS